MLFLHLTFLFSFCSTFVDSLVGITFSVFFLFANILEFFLFDNYIISYLLLVCYVSLLANFVSYMYCWIVPTFISAFVTFISYMHEHHPFSSFFFFFFCCFKAMSFQNLALIRFLSMPQVMQSFFHQTFKCYPYIPKHFLFFSFV